MGFKEIFISFFLITLLLIPLSAHAEILGVELVTNGAFSNGETGWDFSDDGLYRWEVVSEQARFSSTDLPVDSTLRPSPGLGIEVGKKYIVSYNVVSGSGPYSAIVMIGGSDLSASVGFHQEEITATSTGNLKFWINPEGPQAITFIVDDVSVKEVLPPPTVEITRIVPSPLVPDQPAVIELHVDVDEGNLPIALGIEETVPAGWTVSNISHYYNAKYDSDTGTVSWMFWEGGNDVRDVIMNYTVTPSSDHGGFSGRWVTETEEGYIDYPKEYVDSCQPLDQAYTTYYLANSITNNLLTGNCMIITAPAVDFDCQGHSITSDDDVAGVYSNQNYTTIRNCVISMADGYVKQSGSQYTASGGTGIRLNNADHSRIYNNTLNLQRDGLNLDKTDNSVIEDITANQNIWLAIKLRSSHNNTLNNIHTYDNGYPHVYGSFGKGVEIQYSNNNILTNLFLDSDKDGGIQLSSSNYNDFTNVVISREADKEIYYGIDISRASNNVFTDIEVNSIKMGGIRLQTNSNYNHFYDFKISNSPRSPFGYRSSIEIIDSSDNTFAGGYVDKSTNYGVSCFSSYGSESSNNLFKDMWIDNTNLQDILILAKGSGSGAANNTFLNVTYDPNSVKFVNYGRPMELIRKWYYRAHVEDSGGSDVEGASVSAYNSEGVLIESLITNSSGWTETGSLIDYVDSGGKNYYSPYTIYAVRGGDIDYHTYNVSSANNLNDPFTLEPTETLVVHSETLDVTAGQTSVFDLIHAGLTIDNLEFTPLDNFTETHVVVEQSSLGGTFKVKDIFGVETYTFINISLISGGEDIGQNITDVIIKFSVSKGWLSSTGVDPNSIIMYVYEGGSWNTLPTTMTGSDSNYYYYQAAASHLSVLAVGGTVSVTGMQTGAAPGFEMTIITLLIITVFLSVLMSLKMRKTNGGDGGSPAAGKGVRVHALKLLEREALSWLKPVLFIALFATFSVSVNGYVPVPDPPPGACSSCNCGPWACSDGLYVDCLNGCFACLCNSYRWPELDCKYSDIGYYTVMCDWNDTCYDACWASKGNLCDYDYLRQSRVNLCDGNLPPTDGCDPDDCSPCPPSQYPDPCCTLDYTHLTYSTTYSDFKCCEPWGFGSVCVNTDSGEDWYSWDTECCAADARPCSNTAPDGDTICQCCAEPTSACYAPRGAWEGNGLGRCPRGTSTCHECRSDRCVDCGEDILSQSCISAGETGCCYGECFNPDEGECCVTRCDIHELCEGATPHCGTEYAYKDHDSDPTTPDECVPGWVVDPDIWTNKTCYECADDQDCIEDFGPNFECCYGECYNTKDERCCSTNWCEGPLIASGEDGCGPLPWRHSEPLTPDYHECCDEDDDGLDDFVCGVDENCCYARDPNLFDDNRTCEDTELVWPFGCFDDWDNDCDGLMDCDDPDCNEEQIWILPADSTFEDLFNGLIPVADLTCGMCVRRTDKYDKTGAYPKDHICCGKEDTCSRIEGAHIEKGNNCDWDWDPYDIVVNYEKYCYLGTEVENQAPYERKVCCKGPDMIDPLLMSFEPNYIWMIQDLCNYRGYPIVDGEKCNMNPRTYMPSYTTLYTKPIIEPPIYKSIYYKGIQGDPPYSSFKMDLIDKHAPPPDPYEGISGKRVSRTETPKSNLECKYVGESFSGYELDNSTGMITPYTDTASTFTVAGGGCDSFDFDPVFDTIALHEYRNLPLTITGYTNGTDDGSLLDGSVCTGENIETTWNSPVTFTVTPAAAEYLASYYAESDIKTKAHPEGFLAGLFAGTVDAFPDYSVWENADYPKNFVVDIKLETPKATYANDYGVPDQVTLKIHLEGDVMHRRFGIGPVPVGKPVYFNSMTTFREELFEKEYINTLMKYVKRSTADIPWDPQAMDNACYRWLTTPGWGDIGADALEEKNHGRVIEDIEITLTNGLVLTASDNVRIVRHKSGSWLGSPLNSLICSTCSSTVTLNRNDLIDVMTGSGGWGASAKDAFKKLVLKSDDAAKIVFMNILQEIGEQFEPGNSVSKGIEDLRLELNKDGEIDDEKSYGGPPGIYKCDDLTGNIHCDDNKTFCENSCSGDWERVFYGTFEIKSTDNFDTGLWPKFELFSKLASFKIGTNTLIQIGSWFHKGWLERWSGIVQSPDTMYVLREDLGVEGEGYNIYFDSTPNDNITKIFHDIGDRYVLQLNATAINEECDVVVESSESWDVGDNGRVTTRSPISYYMFNGSAEDGMGNNDGTPYGVTFIDDDPERRNVASFDGSGDYVETGNIHHNKITVSAWFKTTDTAANQRIVSKTQGGEYQLSLNEGSVCGSSTYCFLVRVGGTYYAASIPVSGLEDNVWYHAVGTYDGETVRLYLNGALADENTNPSGSITSNNAPICIGSEATSSACTGGAYFNGSVDDVIIFNRALSEEEITDIYYGVFSDGYYTTNDGSLSVMVPETAFVGPATGTVEKIEISNCNLALGYLFDKPDYISHYEFDGNADDETGNNDGTPYGVTFIDDDTERGYVASFDGSGDYVETGNVHYDQITVLLFLGSCRRYILCCHNPRQRTRE
jgi:PGF-pre-PGF domain-containing protein